MSFKNVLFSGQIYVASFLFSVRLLVRVPSVLIFVVVYSIIVLFSLLSFLLVFSFAVIILAVVSLFSFSLYISPRRFPLYCRF